MESMRFILPQNVDEEWLKVKEWIAEANSYAGGRYSPQDWLVKLLTGQAELYIGDGMCVVGEAMQYPRKRVYQIILAGGNGGHDWIEIEAELEHIARSRGCSSMEVYGRPGWKKILTQAGYSIPLYVYQKELRNE